MDDVLLKQINRRLKFLNIFLAFFGILFLVGFAIVGVLLYKVITFAHTAENKISNIEQKTSQSLDVKKQICDSNSLSSLLDSATDTCK